MEYFIVFPTGGENCVFFFFFYVVFSDGVGTICKVCFAFGIYTVIIEFNMMAVENK